MAKKRTIIHEAEPGSPASWSVVALHLEPASDGKDGFYLTLFPDGRGPIVLFLRSAQLTHLIELANTSSDSALWEALAQIPLEPLLPNRSLAAKLHLLLKEQGAAIEQEVRRQIERPAPLPPPFEEVTKREAATQEGAETHRSENEGEGKSLATPSSSKPSSFGSGSGAD